MHSHVPLDLVGLLEGKEVMVGVIDVASDTVETPDEVAGTIGRALQFVARDEPDLYLLGSALAEVRCRDVKSTAYPGNERCALTIAYGDRKERFAVDADVRD